MQVLLEMDFIPAGMELFPAADEDQWELIKRVIDDCDYYMVIVGGRYGSIGPDGYSYTEMEYRYAMEKGIPTVGFVHSDPGSISADKTDPEKRDKLDQFIELVRKKMTKDWSNPEGLGSAVVRSLTKLKSQKPGVGWVRGDAILDAGESNELRKELQDLQKVNKNLEQQVAALSKKEPEIAEELDHGDDLLRIDFSWWGITRSLSEIDKNMTMNTTWNEMFGYLSPRLPAATSSVKVYLESYLNKYAKQHSTQTTESSADIDDEQFQTIKIQLIALGLINFDNTYWSLTSYGERLMMELRTIKKKTEPEAVEATENSSTSFPAPDSTIQHTQTHGYGFGYLESGLRFAHRCRGSLPCNPSRGSTPRSADQGDQSHGYGIGHLESRRPSLTGTRKHALPSSLLRC